MFRARRQGQSVRENRGVAAVIQSSFCRAALTAGALIVALTAPALAQDDDEGPRRTRISVGAHAYPSFPGSDDFDIGPLLDLDRARGDEPFRFEAADESFGFSLIDSGGFRFGPVVNFEGSRSAADVGAALPKVKFSLEPGGFVSFDLAESFRLRAEVRKGVSGHKGWIGMAGADYVARDGDAWLFAIGPRVTWSNDRYQDAWFGVAPADAVASGLPAYDPDGGIQAYGAAASIETQLSSRWGLFGYAKYDRLVGDAADSPIVRQLGSRDQFAGGLGLSYTFGEGVE
jgi:outer membrane scaffolding protein for murein synthesis (MipA/OmpV family)